MHLHLSDKELPEIKNWKVGGKYQIILTVEQQSLSKRDMSDYESIEAGFKILKAQVPGKDGRKYSKNAINVAKRHSDY